MMWYYGSGGWDWVWMAGMMLLFWGGVIALAIWAIRIVTAPRKVGGAALDLLRRRLAAGEITAEEFEKIRKALSA